ncbi:DUF2169 domain-containing protein [Pendulispora rubella]|uniref:DUF2169 domain-containing protein n=1 Tax=Pendulispora rubella TaxID=2741070 RepID=A0ABZ2KSQ3_9BACT
MKFINETPWQARFFFGGGGETVNLAWVAARATFRLENRRTLVPADEPWPVFVTPVRTTHGTFPSDDAPSRNGCDLIVTGTALSQTPVSWLKAHVRAGDFGNDIFVVGDRIWKRSGRSLVASDPRPFTAMPVDWSRAFGGTTLQEGLPVPDPINPEGRGAYLSPDHAADNPLPNLEDPNAPVRNWNDRPLPVAWSPIANSHLWQIASWLGESSKSGRPPPNADEIMRQSAQCYVCAAPPRNVMPELRAGAPVDIALGETRASFHVPPIELALRVEIGAERISCPLKFSGLWVFVDAQLVVLSLRASFRYVLRPFEKRVAILQRAHLPIGSG